MITADAACEIARHHVLTLGDDLKLFEEPIISGDFGWVFSFQSNVYIETNDMRDALAGNAPILVDRESGVVFTLGTAHEIEKYLQAYERFGDPHAEPGPTLELVNWRTGVNKVAATKEIKVRAQLGLKDAKEAVDNCLNGQKPLVRCADAETADSLVRKLDAVGIVARQLAM